MPKGHTILGVIRKEGPDPTEILFLNSVKSQCPNGKDPGLGLFSFVAIYFWEGHFVSKALFLLSENGDSYTSFIYCIGCFFESALDKSLRVVSGVDLGSTSVATSKSIFTVVDLLLQSVYSSLLSTALVSLLDWQLHS